MDFVWDERFRSCIIDALPRGSAQHLTPTADLTALGLDSMASVQLLVALEETYDMKFPEELLASETFATPDSLWRAVKSLRDAVENN